MGLRPDHVPAAYFASRPVQSEEKKAQKEEKKL